MNPIESIYNSLGPAVDGASLVVERQEKTAFRPNQPPAVSNVYVVTLSTYIGDRLVMGFGYNADPLRAAREAHDDYRDKLAVAEARASRLPVKCEVMA